MCLEMQNHVCHSFHDDVRGGSYSMCLGDGSICSGNRIRLNPKGGQACNYRISPQHEY